MKSAKRKDSNMKRMQKKTGKISATKTSERSKGCVILRMDYDVGTKGFWASNCGSYDAKFARLAYGNLGYF